MNNAIFSLNTITIVIILAAACFAIFSKKILASVIALGVVGCVMALEFVILQAPDVALAEAAVGAVITTIIFIITVYKTRKKEDKTEE